MKRGMLILGFVLFLMVFMIGDVRAVDWWVSDDSIVQGLVDKPAVPVKLSYNLNGDNLWRGMNNNRYGYYWNVTTTSWIRDDSILVGAPWTLDQLVYNLTGDGKWTFISTWHQDVSGYYWNGEQWVQDDSRIAGLVDPLIPSGANFWAYGEDVERGFIDNSLTYWLSTYSDKNVGYYWNGTYWVQDDRRVYGLPLNSFGWSMFYDSSCGEWNAVTAGGYDNWGSLSTYYWNGFQWIEDAERAPAGLSDYGYTLDVVDNITGDGNRWLIVGGASQRFYGFRYIGGCIHDQDNDSVQDNEDLCPETPVDEGVNADGCSCSQIEIPLRNCSLDSCVEENFVDYPENGFDTCVNGEIIATYSCEPLSSTYDLQCDPDDDNDSIIDNEDKCPNTSGQQIVYGCSCEQILALKPGEDTLINKDNCSKGVIDVFTKAIGWAKDLFNQ